MLHLLLPTGAGPDVLEYLLAGAVSGLTFVASDVVSQLFLHRTARLHWFQVSRLGIFGFAIKGPLQSLYYNLIEALLPGKGGIGQIMVKMLVDLFFFSPFVNILFLLMIPLLEGRTPKAAWRNVTSELIPVQKAALKFWVVAHALNYTAVTSNYRVLYVNCMGFLWTVILCCVAHKSSNKAPGKSLQNPGQPHAQMPHPVQVNLVGLKQAGRSCSDYSTLIIKQQLEDFAVSSSPRAEHLHNRAFNALHLSPLRLPPRFGDGEGRLGLQDVEFEAGNAETQHLSVQPKSTRGRTISSKLRSIVVDQLPGVARTPSLVQHLSFKDSKVSTSPPADQRHHRLSTSQAESRL